MMNRIWNDESGVLTFEWILLLTLLVIGIVGGLAAVRDAYIIELTSAAQAITALDLGYSIAFPVNVTISVDAAANPINAAGLTSQTPSSAAGTLYLDMNSAFVFDDGGQDTIANVKALAAEMPTP